MKITDYTTTDLLFSHWMNRKGDILNEGDGTWKGSGHPSPIPIHKAIDNRLDALRHARNPNASIYILDR